MSETSSANFPDDIALQFAQLTVGRIESTQVETARSGREVRQSEYPEGGYRYYSITTAPLGQTDAQTLRDFLIARRGRLQAFQFYPTPETYLQKYAGQVAGSTYLTVPFKSGVYTAVWFNTTNDVSGASEIPFNVVWNFGSYGEDKIVFGGEFVLDGNGDRVLDQHGNPITSGSDVSRTGYIWISGRARPRVLVRSDIDRPEASLLATLEYHTVWTLRFKEVI